MRAACTRARPGREPRGRDHTRGVEQDLATWNLATGYAIDGATQEMSNVHARKGTLTNICSMNSGSISMVGRSAFLMLGRSCSARLASMME